MVGVPNFKRKPIIRPKLTPSMVYLIYNIMLKFSYIYHPKSVYPPILKTTSYPIKCERQCGTPDSILKFLWDVQSLVFVSYSTTFHPISGLVSVLPSYKTQSYAKNVFLIFRIPTIYKDDLIKSCFHIHSFGAKSSDFYCLVQKSFVLL